MPERTDREATHLPTRRLGVLHAPRYTRVRLLEVHLNHRYILTGRNSANTLHPAPSGLQPPPATCANGIPLAPREAPPPDFPFHPSVAARRPN